MKKFGTFKGVFVPSTEAILGTVLFLLLPVLVADVGLLTILIIIVLSHTVTVATAFSLSDCATNLNHIGGGGMYALSKRSVGKAFGGSIGIQLYLAQAASIGFYCIGFSEPLQPMLAPLLNKISFFAGTGAEAVLFQKQVLSSFFFILFFTIVMIGADFTLKIQMTILFILIFSVVFILISPFLQIEFNNQALFVDSFSDINIVGNRQLTIPIFFLVFAQFFPAVTGIDAGVGMSGELKDPKKSLVRGTFSAIIVTFIVYILAAIVFSLMRKEALLTGYEGNSPVGNILTDLLGFGKKFPENIPGLIVMLGILFATSSSALSFFMTAPRTAKSLEKDHILPPMFRFLSKDFKPGGREPRYATLLTFFIGFSIIWMGNIMVAATIVGISFLIVYGWVNLSAFFERVSKNPTFRPTSWNHWAISFYGFLAAIAAIALFNLFVGVIIFVTQYIIFRLILKYKSQNKLEGVWWGVVFRFVASGLKALHKIVMGSKNWRPILTAISFDSKGDNPDKIAYLARKIADYKGIVDMNIISKEGRKGEKLDVLSYGIPTSLLQVSDKTEAILTMIQSINFGGIESNSILLEYKSNVNTVKIINKVLELKKNFLLIRNSVKLDLINDIDIWWRGEKNGNLMVLLAYIIKSSEDRVPENIRIIRKLGPDDDAEQSRQEMLDLLQYSRLSGEVVILPFADEDFMETLRKHSSQANLIMMGLPGNYTSESGKKYFKINEFFFNKEINKYSDLPPIIFVKSAYVLNLIEE